MSARPTGRWRIHKDKCKWCNGTHWFVTKPSGIHHAYTRTGNQAIQEWLHLQRKAQR